MLRRTGGLSWMFGRSRKPRTRYAVAVQPKQPEWGAIVTDSRMSSGEWAKDDYLHGLSNKEYSELEMSLLKQAFAEYDLDKNGVLDREEIQAALAGLGLNSSVEAVDKIFRIYDANSDGVISLEEWLGAETQALRNEILKAFSDRCA